MSSTPKALALALAVIALLIAVAVEAHPTSRILGGEDATGGDFPQTASVRLDGVHLCGGSIIGERHILTAAHCVVDDNNKVVAAGRVSVRVGSINQFAGGKLVYVIAIAVHPDYIDFQSDVAVVTLDGDLSLSEKLAIIPLATSEAEEPSVGAKVQVAGWGEQLSGATPYKLQSSNFTVASEADCTNAYADHDESTICLAHSLKEGNCRGDAGNGAIYNNKLVGVSSFVVGACGSRFPDVFANVAHFAAWIQSVLA